MTLLKGARFALAASALLYVLALGLGWAAMSFGLNPVAEGLYVVGLAAIGGMIAFSILCVVAQIGLLFSRPKASIRD